MKTNISDILNCLANLSSDEVFTSPELANKMLDLLPQELFSNPNTKFLDPCSKSGVFLREIAKRLLIGLETQIPDLQERINHIMSKQLFGIALTQLTAEMSRRTLYCAKKADGAYSVTTCFTNEQGNLRYMRCQHVWVAGKCKHCEANRAQYDRGDTAENYAYPFIHKPLNEIFKDMQFDVIIGNPPYQLDDGGYGASAKALYPIFVEQALKLNPHYLSMIIPARWYAGGKDLGAFRNSMINDSHIKDIHDFADAADCFSGVEIKGGVCYFLWQKDYHGLVNVVTHSKGRIISEMKRKIKEKGCDTFIRQNEAISILHKIQNANEKSFAEIVYPAMTFGIRTYVRDFDSDTAGEGLTKVYAQKTIGYIRTSKIMQGKAYINCWKIIIPEAIGTGELGKDLIKPILSEPNSINTETYIMNGPYKSKEEAENAITYIKTKFFHFLIGLKKITQHATQKVYQFAPFQDFSQPWTDEMLYEKYGLTEEEIGFIESMIKPME